MSLRFLTISLSFLTVVVSASPLFSIVPKGIFFGFDPDAVYIANALSYVQSHQIQYAEHPGTPAIWVIAQSFIPLRLYAKYIVGQPFITWAFLHYDFIFTYSRLFQACLLGAAVFIWLTALWQFTRSHLAVIFAWVALFGFRVVPYLGSIISPETLSVLLVGTWLLVLSFFFKSRSPATLLGLALIAGLALANKTTNISLVLATLVLFPRTKLVNFVLTALAIAAGFLIGIWPIRDRLLLILKINIDFATHTGAHGSGRRALIDIPMYLANLQTFHLQNPIILPLLLGGLVLAIYSLAAKSKKIPVEISLIYLLVFFVFAGFLKFPLFHYQLANYLVLLFLAGVFISAFFKPALFFLSLIISLVYLPVSVQAYYREAKQLADQSAALEDFITNNPPQIATVWEWGRARDFAYIWARGWGGGLFDSQFKRYRPELLELKSDFTKINLNYRDQKSVFDACWDQLYIQQQSAPKFLALYSDQTLVYQTIPGTPMALITSTHCFEK